MLCWIVYSSCVCSLACFGFSFTTKQNRQSSFATLSFVVVVVAATAAFVLTTLRSFNDPILSLSILASVCRLCCCCCCCCFYCLAEQVYLYIRTKSRSYFGIMLCYGLPSCCLSVCLASRLFICPLDGQNNIS